jgi:hypothetical protein
MTHLDTGIAVRKTIADQVEAYQKAAVLVDTAYQTLEDARMILAESFSEDPRMFDMIDRYHTDTGTKGAEHIKNKLKQRVWRHFIELLGVRKILSVKKSDELDKQLDDPKTMPDITTDIVFGTFNSMMAQSHDFLEDAIKEVYNFLRPGAKDWNKLKTNTKNGRFDIGKKVIISRAADKRAYACWYLISSSEPSFIALDKVFHSMDGKGIPEGYRSPLVDAINTSVSGSGETEYFSFQCYQNNNLHLSFKRMDLVAKLNAVAGGQSLKGA